MSTSVPENRKRLSADTDQQRTRANTLTDAVLDIPRALDEVEAARTTWLVIASADPGQQRHRDLGIQSKGMQSPVHLRRAPDPAAAARGAAESADGLPASPAMPTAAVHCWRGVRFPHHAC